MIHSEKYLDALHVVKNKIDYDPRDWVEAKRYINAYMDGYNQALKKPSTQTNK